MNQPIKYEFSGSDSLLEALSALIGKSTVEIELAQPGDGQIVISAHLDDSAEANTSLEAIKAGKYLITYNQKCITEEFIQAISETKGSVLYNSALAFCDADNLKYVNVSRKNIKSSVQYLTYTKTPSDDVVATYLLQDIDRAINAIDPDIRRRSEALRNQLQWEKQQAAQLAALEENLTEVSQPCGIDPTYE